MEPFWDLKISKDVEYLMRVCIQQIPYKLHVNFSDKYGWLNFSRSLGLCNSLYK